MEFIALIIALALHQVIRSDNALQRDGWLHALEGSASGLISAPGMAAVGAVLLPAVVTYWALDLIDGWLFGLIELLGLVAVLVWTLGRDDYHTALERLAASQADHPDSEDACVAGLWAPSPQRFGEERNEADVVKTDGDGHGEGTGSAVEAPLAEPDAIQVLAYSGYARWFAPLLYMLIGGPVLAVVYRVIAVLARHTGKQIYAILLAYADWLPSRLLVLTFALTGDFLAVSGRRSVGELLSLEPTPEILADSAGVACASPGSARALGDLLYRSAGLWLLLISLGMIFR
ncbi:MAG: hypothetical protein AAGG55_14000 [Pseudomonadota bacterium]